MLISIVASFLSAFINPTFAHDKITVAVPDTGVYMGHSAFKNRIWTNPNETAGNGIDDDHNGYIDDIHGWNFIDNNNDLSDDRHPLGHGTAVAGVIARNPNVKLMILKACNSRGRCTRKAQAAAIIYAVKNGARLINASWGEYEKRPLMKHVMNWAFEKGVLVITGSGNDSADLDGSGRFYPTSFRTHLTLSVTHTGYRSRLHSEGNTGATSVHLAAPGYRILSPSTDGRWQQMTGTSFAAPVVTDVGATILSIQPTFSVLTLRNALLNAVTERESYLNHLATSGAINAEKAVKQLSAGFQVWPAQMSLRPGDSFQFTAYRARGKVRWRVSKPKLAQINSQGTLKALRPGTLKIYATDEQGKTVSTRWLRIMQRAPARKGS